MQNTIFHVAANETLGVVRDFANAKTIAAPTLVRGVEVCLKMRLFAKREGMEPYPIESLADIATWQWAMDNDFSESTTYKLVGDNANIAVSQVTENFDGEEHTYTEISIPMPGMNTVELSTWLGSEKTRNGLHGELLGIDVHGRHVFILQVENFTVRNRITSAGNPTDIPSEYMTIPQIEALFCAKLEVQLSEDGGEWTTVEPEAGVESSQNYRWYRFRNSSVGSVWSDALPLLIGPRGYTGTLHVGTVTQEEVARVENVGTEHDAVFDFGLPKGDKGDAATITVGTVTTTPAGTSATITNAGTANDAVFNFTVPKGDKGDKGNTGNAATFTLGDVMTGQPGTDVIMSNSGNSYAAILNFTIPRGEKGEKGDRSTVQTGTTTTGLPGTQASVINTGTEQNAVFSFTIPRGDQGECSYLYTAWAWDANGTGFSLTPTPDRKYRAETFLTEHRPVTEADFAGSTWVKCLGDDGATIGAVAVTDTTTIVPGVSRIVFENATVRLGSENEAIISFPAAGVSPDEAFNSFFMIREELVSQRSGGGSSGGNVGIIQNSAIVYNEPSATDNTQSTWY